MATFHSLLQMIAEYIWRICGGMESRFVRIVVLFLRSIHTNGIEEYWSILKFLNLCGSLRYCLQIFVFLEFYPLLCN